MADAWQPIETCPKTDMENEYRVRRFDVWVVDPHWEDEFKTSTYQWREADAYWEHRETTCPRWLDSTGDTIEDNGRRVTHWMPIPDGPNGRVHGKAEDAIAKAEGASQ